MKKKKEIDIHQIADEVYRQDKRLAKEDRKAMQAKDRSKYKKSDFEKFQEELERELLSKANRETLKEGRVISIRSEGIIVSCEGTEWTCMLRGLLKKIRTSMKNLVAVGDIVLFEPLEGSEGMIVYVKPRTSTLGRAENLYQNKQQVLAANVDQVLITTSVVFPPLKPTLIDRYIIAAEKGGLKPIVLVNKIDLIECEYEEQFLQDFLEAHRAAGIRVLTLSVAKGIGLDELKEVMKDKSSVFSGQSGVGKSSLINAVTGLNLKVGDVVERSRKGSHTTTTASLIPLSFGGFVVDTPGVKSFGVWNIGLDELQFYFPEFDPYREKCKFQSCTHTHEPSCAVIEAVEAGQISAMRYDSYRALYDEISSDFLKR